MKNIRRHCMSENSPHLSFYKLYRVNINLHNPFSGLYIKHKISTAILKNRIQVTLNPVFFDLFKDNGDFLTSYFSISFAIPTKRINSRRYPSSSFSNPF